MSDRRSDVEATRRAGLDLADEVRALIADVNRSAPDVGALEEARVHVAAARMALASPDRRRWYEVPLDEIDEDTTIRLREEAGDHSMFRGGRNPLAPPLRVSTGVDSDGEPVVVGEVHLDRSREGPPERVHGGMVAGIFDDVLSGAPGLVDAGPVVTARLSIRYRLPTPLDVQLRFEARVVRHSGRRLVARARCLAPTTDGGTEVTAEAEAPRVLLADRDGITVLQDGAAHDLSLDAIAYDDAGEVTISGRGQPGGTVRLYLDNGLVGDVPVGPAGQWRMTLPESVEAGIYTLRVDEVAEDGTVMARVESPFKREDREMLAAALGRASEAREGEAAAQDEVEMAEADMADPAPTATTEDMAAGDETAAAPEPTPMPAETAEAVTGTAGEDEAPAMPAEPADTAQAGEDPAVPDTPAAEGAVESGAAPPANAGDAPEAAEAPMEAAPDAPEAGDTVTAAMDSDAPDTASAPDMPPADSDPKAPAAEPMISAITVQPGSTLWAISRERYGDGLLYVQVFEANRDKIRDPDLIYPGQVFELPADVSGN